MQRDLDPYGIYTRKKKTIKRSNEILKNNSWRLKTRLIKYIPCCCNRKRRDTEEDVPTLP